MTRITFFKHDGIYYGFEEKGHTGYGESGDDILCAALSAMSMLIINAIEVSFNARVDYQIDEKTTDIKVIAKDALPEVQSDERIRFAVSGILQAYYYQLNDMLEDYYDYIEVNEIED